MIVDSGVPLVSTRPWAGGGAATPFGAAMRVGRILTVQVPTTVAGLRSMCSVQLPPTQAPPPVVDAPPRWFVPVANSVSPFGDVTALYGVYAAVRSVTSRTSIDMDVNEPEAVP